MSAAPNPTVRPGHDPHDPSALLASRVLAATPARVYAAFADPAVLARWWGPDGFRNTIHAFDLREGGLWRMTMHGPDGTDYPNEARFMELKPGERWVIHHKAPPWFELTATFAAHGDGATVLTWRQRFENAAVCEALAPMCVPANQQNFDRLAAVLAQDAA